MREREDEDEVEERLERSGPLLALASGVRYFEPHEGAVLAEGYDGLIDTLRGVLPLTRDHLEAASRNTG